MVMIPPRNEGTRIIDCEKLKLLKRLKVRFNASGIEARTQAV